MGKLCLVSSSLCPTIPSSSFIPTLPPSLPSSTYCSPLLPGPGSGQEEPYRTFPHHCQGSQRQPPPHTLACSCAHKSQMHMYTHTHAQSHFFFRMPNISYSHKTRRLARSGQVGIYDMKQGGMQKLVAHFYAMTVLKNSVYTVSMGGREGGRERIAHMDRVYRDVLLYQKCTLTASPSLHFH